MAMKLNTFQLFNADKAKLKKKDGKKSEIKRQQR